MASAKIRRVVSLAVGAAVTGASMFLVTAPAHAATLMTVCHADNVYLRTEPVGPVIDNLPAGSHVNVYEITPGGWAHGTSYYDNTSGYVDANYLC